MRLCNDFEDNKMYLLTIIFFRRETPACFVEIFLKKVKKIFRAYLAFFRHSRPDGNPVALIVLYSLRVSVRLRAGFPSGGSNDRGNDST